MEEIIITILFYLSGAAYGITQGILFHYNKYYRFNLNPYFWNPDVSWLNKYKSGSITEPKFFGSTTFLAWTTDAYHLFSTISRFILIASFVFIPMYYYNFISSTCAFIGLYGTWMLGFHTTYR
jgi:hypothetical protein